jgi:hypothetical protein
MYPVVDDAAVLPVGKSTDILAGNPRDDLPNDLFALTPYDHVDIRTTVEQGLDLLCCFMASDNRTHLRRHLGYEITDLVEPGFPLDAYTKEIDFVSDEPAEDSRVLVSLFIPKIKEGHLADEVFHACGDVLEAGGREESLDGLGRIAEIGVQGKSMSVSGH